MDHPTNTKYSDSSAWGAVRPVGWEGHYRRIKHRGGLAAAMVLWLSRRQRKFESCVLFAVTLLVCQVVRWW